MAAERLKIYYSGQVQGVGFRWRASRAVEGLNVTGYVRNLRDGRVELVIEGPPAETSAAADRIRSALGALINREESNAGAATGEFEGFSIRP